MAMVSPSILIRLLPLHLARLLKMIPPVLIQSFVYGICKIRLLLGWLRFTISGYVLSQYVHCQTSASLWSALHRVYSAVSSAKIMELRLLLQSHVEVRGIMTTLSVCIALLTN
jgi:hypothetical protein